MSSIHLTNGCLISLRPAGEHESLRRHAARVGIALLALSPWKLRSCAGETARGCLRMALDAPCVLFTSPAAVKAAAGLAALHPRQGQYWLAVGAGTAEVLKRLGVAGARAPARMDSEGVLALPELAQVDTVGLVTAPGGRGLIAATLEQRGIRLIRANVYERVPIRISAERYARLRALTARPCTVVSSGEALRHVMHQLPGDIATMLRNSPIVVASRRLAQLAEDQGFSLILQAAGPRPRQLLDAAVPVLRPNPGTAALASGHDAGDA
ncbi:MAG: uroporphyrinogen-III synthase [Xanthomonadaceae bacterium]|jgi:uroporphyrinogen-III synthase|nr:uroporphyrinogen-III synthase [Xanthomonadaceae bacterium]